MFVVRSNDHYARLKNALRPDALAGPQDRATTTAELDRLRFRGEIMPSVLYLADRGSHAFETNRNSIDVVCAGDSITGWNNFGEVRQWPYQTYPEFVCESLGLSIANGGIAGEVSANVYWFSVNGTNCLAR